MDNFEQLLNKNRKDASIAVLLQGFKYSDNIAKIVDKKADQDIALLHDLNKKDYLKKNKLTTEDIKQYGKDMKDSFSKSKGNLFKNTATAVNYGIIKPFKGIKGLLNNPIENDIESITQSRKSLNELKKYYENIEKVARAHNDDSIIDLSIAMQSKINVLDSQLSIKEDETTLEKIYKNNDIDVKSKSKKVKKESTVSQSIKYTAPAAKTGGLSLAGGLLAGGIGSIIPTLVRMLISNPIFLSAVVAGVAGISRAVQLSRDVPGTLTMDSDFNDHIEEVQASYKEIGYEGKTPVDEYNERIQEQQNLKELKDYIIFRNNSDRDWNKLNSELRTNFEKFAKYYFEQTKTKVIVTSGYRSSEKQQAMLDLWNSNEAEAKKQGIVYKPASANGPHTQGNAIDISQQSLISDIDTMLNIYGLHRPIPSDPVHITLKKITESSKESNTKINEIKNMYMTDNYYKRISSTLKLGSREEIKGAERPSKPFNIDKNKNIIDEENDIKYKPSNEFKTKNQVWTDENKVNEGKEVPKSELNDEFRNKQTKEETQNKEVPKAKSVENNVVPTPQIKEDTLNNNVATTNNIDNSSTNVDNSNINNNAVTDNSLQLKENSITIFKYNNDETKKLHTR